MDKIFQKGGDGSQASRGTCPATSARATTPPGAILNADFRRSIAELNVACDDASYARVAESCAFESALEPPGGPSPCARSRTGSRTWRGTAAASPRSTPPPPPPLTGVETKRVPLSIHEAVRYDAKRGSVNDPDYYPRPRPPELAEGAPGDRGPERDALRQPRRRGRLRRLARGGERRRRRRRRLSRATRAPFASPPATRRANDSPSPGDPADPAGRAFLPARAPTARRCARSRRARSATSRRVA